MMVLQRVPTPPRLSELLLGMAAFDPGDDREIHGLALDSRRVRPGDLFLALPGAHTSGLRYIADAVGNGAVAVVVDEQALQQADPEPGALAQSAQVPIVAVPGLAHKIGHIAERFFGEPARRLQVIGITGTNGKTSCAHFLAQALDRRGERCGVIGTLGHGFREALEPADHTTPDAVTVHRLLAQMCDRGASRVVMEVSSHGLDQGRVAGVPFRGALFTNLSRDHLDYHRDMEAYGAVKRRLFHWPGLEFAVVNADDPFGRGLLAELPPALQGVAYGIGLDDGLRRSARAFVSAEALERTPEGVRFRLHSSWGECRIAAPLLGRINVSNLLGVAGVLLALGVSPEDVAERLQEIEAVPGRLERFQGGPQQPVVVVDYAHNPDALQQVLLELRAHCRGELWVVFGCGGERDRGKRPMMGSVAERYADRVVVTEDNPRREDPTEIVSDIMTGMRDPDRAYVRRGRAQAIEFAIRYARAQDLVLIAGKGHEAYQQIGEQRLPFSDRAWVQALLGSADRWVS